jgi:hypothetical protein
MQTKKIILVFLSGLSTAQAKQRQMVLFIYYYLLNNRRNILVILFTFGSLTSEATPRSLQEGDKVFN